MKTFHDNHRIKVDGKTTWLLSHWLTDDGVAICVSGPDVLLLHEHVVTEEDGNPLSLTPNMKSKTTKRKKPLTPLEMFIDGLEAGTDGRGYGEEHEKARLLLEAAPDLLAALKALYSAAPCAKPANAELWEALQLTRAAIRKTELVATT